ncbi:MAG: hypothetical protein IT548_01915 [Alphaproteobacteria bacterium]|nr:hypothetical protein [Alphaproteobacteria bacterium]
MIPLVNPSLVAAANPQGSAQSQAARKANAEAYAAAMRDAGAPSAPRADAQSRPQVATAFAREAPFGVERPRYQRPGSILDLVV